MELGQSISIEGQMSGLFATEPAGLFFNAHCNLLAPQIKINEKCSGVFGLVVNFLSRCTQGGIT
jgi:hypothetical protein